jgi:hypothetical protein
MYDMVETDSKEHTALMMMMMMMLQATHLL